MKFTQEKLKEISNILKKEFDDSEDLIDSIMKYVSLWNSELLDKPVSVPMFGFTGTGKTSIIKRLINLLSYEDKSVIFDTEVRKSDTEEMNSLSRKILGGLGLLGNYRPISSVPNDVIFVIDEFQRARTINEEGCEVNEVDTGCIWNLLDGNLPIETTYYDNHLISRIKNYYQYLITITNNLDLSSIKLSKYRSPKDGHDHLVCSNNTIVESLKNLEVITRIKTDCRDWGSSDEEFILSIEDTNDEYNKKINEVLDNIKKSTEAKIDEDINEVIKNRFNNDVNAAQTYLYEKLHKIFVVDILCSGFRDSVANGLRHRYTVIETTNIISDLINSNNLKEFIDKLDKIIKIIESPAVINLSKSLIFILGNLDEAFLNYEVKSFNPDSSADTLYKLTSRVSPVEIKHALSRRFRPEQISRLGNNIIIFPTLSKNTFRKIIKRNLNSIKGNFKEKNNIDIEFSSKFIDLIYSEGVYPTQGARSVINTANTVIGTCVNEIYSQINDKPNLNINKVKVDLYIPGGTSFRQNSVEIFYYFYSNENRLFQTNKSMVLTLGTLRNPKNNPRSYQNAIHELGHALLNIIWTGYYPSSINISTINGGGLCEENIDISTKLKIFLDKNIDLDRQVSTLLGGWVSENLFYPKELTSTGCESDLEKVWRLLNSIFMKTGREGAFMYGEHSSNGYMSGFPDKEILPSMKRKLKSVKRLTFKLLKPYKNLIKVLADDLYNLGLVDEDDFKELIQKHLDMKETKQLLKAKESPLIKDLITNKISKSYVEMNWFEKLKTRIKLFFL